MNNTIQTIIEMDKTAREKVKRANAEAQRIAAETEKKLSNLRKTGQSHSEADTGKLCDEIRRQADREIAEITSDADEKCRRLDKVMKEHSDAMCGEIVGRIFAGAEGNG